MKYSHRIAVNASICFDLESDNEVPTETEINSEIGNLIDGAQIEGMSEGTRVYLSESAVSVGGYSIEDTVTNTEEL